MLKAFDAIIGKDGADMVSPHLHLLHRETGAEVDHGQRIIGRMNTQAVALSQLPPAIVAPTFEILRIQDRAGAGRALGTRKREWLARDR